MLRFLIELRKRITIPFFIALDRKKRASNFDYPPKERLLELEKELRLELPMAKRVRDLKKEHEILGKLQLISWLVQHK